MLAKEHVAAKDGFEPADDRLVQRTLEPGLLARLIARLLPGSLDRALIAGRDPAASPRLAARAAKLTEPRFRVAIGEGLERLLETAQSTRRRQSVLHRGGHVVANATALRELSAVLRGTAPLSARGIAIANQLLTDGTGPAYVGGGETLSLALGAARDALDGRDSAGAGRRVRDVPRRERFGPSYQLPDGSWVHCRHDSP